MKQRILYTVLIGVLGLNLFFGARLYLNSAESEDRNDVYRNMVTFTRVLDPARLKLFMLFSSVAGFFGTVVRPCAAALNKECFAEERLFFRQRFFNTVFPQLRAALASLDARPPRLAEALEYALFGGGKRLRPALVRCLSR